MTEEELNRFLDFAEDFKAGYNKGRVELAKELLELDNDRLADRRLPKWAREKLESEKKK